MQMADHIIEIDKKLVFINTFSLQEYMELEGKIIENMINDLSEITGISKDVLMKDYISLNDYDPIREVLRKKGKWIESESIALTEMKRIKQKCCKK